MKIEIEFNSSYEADIIIDGRKMKYGYSGAEGCWKFKDGIKATEHDSTIGGIIAGKLASPLIDILQGWLPDEPNPDGDCWGTWETLTKSATVEVADAIG